MPIRIPSRLPAFSILKSEGVDVMSEREATRQDIRPLKIGLLNLMPKKVQTETQFSRLIGATPLQIDLRLIRMSDHFSKNTSLSHMDAFYRPFSEARKEKYDGLIITGAPVEHLDFNEVSYWDELTQVFDWTQSNVHSTMAVCWGGQAMLNHFHNVPKHMLEEKAFGCFQHENLALTSPYLRGFSDKFSIPVSRWTEIRETDLPTNSGLDLIVNSADTGPCLIIDKPKHALYLFNHLEYDRETLNEEYQRDAEQGNKPNLPKHYFPNDNDSEQPENRWRSHAHLLYGNWLNQIYQTVPFNINDVGT